MFPHGFLYSRAFVWDGHSPEAVVMFGEGGAQPLLDYGCH